MMKSGDVVRIYEDPQTEKKIIGVAKLIEKDKDGLPYILNEMDTHNQAVWRNEYWKIKWLYKLSPEDINPDKRIYPIKTLHNVGIITSEAEDPSFISVSNLLEDKFIEHDGIEAF